MIKAIFFDFDGVIADTYDLNFQINKQLYPDVTKQEFLDLFMGNIYSKKNKKFKKGDMSMFFKKQKQKFTKDNFFPISTILKKMSQQYNLFIISATIDDNLNHFLKLGQLNNYFKKILGATTHKSKTKRFKMIFDKYNFLPEECLFVTDTVGDILEAKEANLDSIAVTWGYHNEQLLINYNPKAIAHFPKELISIIKSLSP